MIRSLLRSAKLAQPSPRAVLRVVLVLVAGIACTTCWVASAERPAKKTTSQAAPKAAAPASAQPAAKPSATQSAPRLPANRSVNFPDEPEVATSPCMILPSHELMITHLSVVENHRATGLGPWSFGGLMARMCPETQDPSDFTENFFLTWIDAARNNPTDFLNIDGPKEPSPAAAEARANALAAFLQAWPRNSEGKLDLARSPLRLMAIVNRLDIKGGDADEIQGRFLFCLLNPDGSPARGTMILEYSLPPVGPNGEPQPVTWWAQEWHKLAFLPLGSNRFLEQLEFITRRFSDRGVMPDRPNGSALIQFRTGEQLALQQGLQVAPVWEFRAFELDPLTGQLRVGRLNRTPHFDYNLYHCDESPSDRCIERLVDFLRENKEPLLAAEYDEWFLQTEIELATSAPTGPFAHWLVREPTPDGFTPREWTSMTIQFFGGRTCNGCHISFDHKVNSEPRAVDLYSHLTRRNAGEESLISIFTRHVIRDVRIPNMQSLLCP